VHNTTATVDVCNPTGLSFALLYDILKLPILMVLSVFALQEVCFTSFMLKTFSTVKVCSVE
jgi:hypothetical protein